jgi:lipopolysaccharide assembly protein A
MRLRNRGSQAARGGADPPAPDHGGAPIASSPDPAFAGRPIMRPAGAQPATEQPPTAQPPTAGQPTTGQPATAQPAAGQPATAQPTADQPATDQPATDQPATTDPATTQAPAAQPPAAPPHHVVRRTRAGGLWVGLALSAIVLLLLLVFILENQQSANISYFGAHGHLPLGVALLLAAVAGALLVVIPGSARIMQLRATARRHRKADAQSRGSGPQPPSQA